MVLVILRHGESEWNQKNIFTGWENPNLSENGIKEAEEAGLILSNFSFNFVYTSDLNRTIQTANIVIDKNILKNNNTKHRFEIRERDYGDLTGFNKSELTKKYGEKQIKIWRRSWDIKPPSRNFNSEKSLYTTDSLYTGESLSDVAVRVGNFYDQEIIPILESNDNNNSNILIVAHGNSLRALFVHLGLKNHDSVEEFEIPTGIPILIDIKNLSFEYLNKYKLNGTQIIDSRGFPTIQVEMINIVSNKIIGKGSTPSGASCGSTEVIELRDGDKKKFMGKSVYNAISNLDTINKKLCLDKICNLIYLDNQLIKLDPTYNKNILGGNTTTAISFCFADVGAKLLDIQLYEYFSKIYSDSIISKKLPTPMVNIINGGKHGVTDDLKIQEFMILCNRDYPIDKQIQIICEVYHGLKNILVNKYGKLAKAIGDEGGFCPPIYSAIEAIQVISESIHSVGYITGMDVFVALDCASSEFYDEHTGLYEIEKNKFLNSSELVVYYENLIDMFPYLVSIEDGFAESDYEGWALFVKKLGHKIMIVGDDLFTTNPNLISKGLEKKLANSLLLKVNQIGTISEAVQGAKLMFDEGLNVIVSHRSGETNHAYIVDLAVGIGAQYLKIGSPCRGERVEKFNRLIEINKLINF
jgi:enolase